MRMYFSVLLRYDGEHVDAFKEINTFINQRYIQLLRSDSKDVSEGSCDTEDWNLEIQLCIKRINYILKYIQMENNKCWQTINRIQNKSFCLHNICVCTVYIYYVTLDHKTSHEGQFFKIEIYTSSESWINKLSIGVWFMIEQYLAEIQLFENLEGAKKKKKIAFKVVQI